jgi:hypothetical protein
VATASAGRARSKHQPELAGRHPDAAPHTTEVSTLRAIRDLGTAILVLSAHVEVEHAMDLAVALAAILTSPTWTTSSSRSSGS